MEPSLVVCLKYGKRRLRQIRLFFLLIHRVSRYLSILCCEKEKRFWRRCRVDLENCAYLWKISSYAPVVVFSRTYINVYGLYMEI